MSILNQKVLGQIAENSELSYNDLPHDAQRRLWKAVRTNDVKSIEELIEKIGKEKYAELEKAVKEDFSDYYTLDFFRNEDLPKPIRNSLITSIFNKVIIENCPSEILTITEGYLERDGVYDIANVLQNIVDFCITYNRSGNYVCSVLKTSYDIGEDISRGLDAIYDKNKLSLKLDYIINKLNEEKEN